MLFGETYEETMAMVNAIGAPVYVVDVEPSGNFMFLGGNSLAEEYFEDLGARGRDVEDLAGLSDLLRSRRKRWLRYFRRCVEVGSQIVMEAEMMELEDGTLRWGRHTCVPIFGESGEIRRLMITSLDITELKETQERLETALTRVLSGFVTICATCKNIKEDSDQWVGVEHYLSSEANDVQFSHGYCPKCYESAVQELK